MGLNKFIQLIASVKFKVFQLKSKSIYFIV